MKYGPSKSHSRKSKFYSSRMFFVALAAVALFGLAATSAFMAAQFTGAIYTTDGTCTGVNINIFSSKDAVYLDGGPNNPNAAGLPDGTYYVQVTEPNGLVLGQSPSANVTVTGGNVVSCYQLSAIVNSASSTFTTPGYDTTSNAGGEYKVWLSANPLFPNNESKTDNFKVIPSDDPNPPQGTVTIVKFYDANANGINDDGQLINGWRMRIKDNIDYIRFTPVSVILAPDDYVITESTPVETNWIATTTNPVNITLADDETENVEFGNLCLGAGGGKTLGFWSNKNGEATMKDDGSLNPELALLSGLNLRTALGTDFNPTTYLLFRSWLLSANATNMAYMLSAQLAAMELNVESGGVDGNALVYAPCLPANTPGLNALGFISINNLMTAANNSLGTDYNTVAASAARTYQECLKTTLDRANNNLNFVQATPCPFSFPELQQ